MRFIQCLAVIGCAIASANLFAMPGPTAFAAALIFACASAAFLERLVEGEYEGGGE